MKAMKFFSIFFGVLAAAFIFGAGMKLAGAGGVWWVDMMFGHIDWKVSATVGLVLSGWAIAMWFVPVRDN